MRGSNFRDNINIKAHANFQVCGLPGSGENKVELMSNFLVKFENSISAKFLMNRALVKVSGTIFEQIRVLTHDESGCGS